MAEQISFDPGRRNLKEERYRQLRAAPKEHLEALLDLYALVQLLHDKGVFELLKDTLGSGEKIMELLTETMERDEVVRTIRNLVIFVKMIGSIEPETLEKLMSSLSNKLESAKAGKPPGLLRLLGQLSDQDSRRALDAVVTGLQVAGRNMSRTRRNGRPRTTRHKA